MTTILHFQLLRVRATVDLAVKVNRVLYRQCLAASGAFETCAMHGTVVENKLVHQIDLLVADVAALNTHKFRLVA